MRLARIGVVAVMLAPIVAGRLQSAAFADTCPSGAGRLTDSLLGASVCVPGGQSGEGGPGTVDLVSRPSVGGSGTSNASGSGQGEPNPYKWSREYLDEYAFPDDWVGPKSVPPDPGCNAANGAENCTQYERGGVPILRTCTGANGAAGRPYRDTLTDTRTGEVVSSAEGCYVAGVSNPSPVGVGGATAQPPPPPPTAAEVIQASNLPRLQFGISPAGKDCSPGGTTAFLSARPCGFGEAPGLTGLETLLWVDPAPADVTVSVNIRGYAVTSRARPVRYNWLMRQPGDTESSRNPDPVIATTTAGTRAAPAARYVWETKGDYRVGLAVVWQGSYTFSGFGVASRTESLGPVTGQPETVPYHVVELRSVPAPTGP